MVVGGPRGVRRGLPLDLTSCDCNGDASCDGDGKPETGTEDRRQKTEDRGFYQRVSPFTLEKCQYLKNITTSKIINTIYVGIL